MPVYEFNTYDFMKIAGHARVSYNTARLFLLGRRKSAPAIAKAIADATAQLGYQLPPHVEAAK